MKTFDREKIGKRLRKYRESYGYSLTKLAEKVYLTPTAIFEHENGRKLTLSNLEIYSDVFDIDLSDLLF